MKNFRLKRLTGSLFIFLTAVFSAAAKPENVLKNKMFEVKSADSQTAEATYFFLENTLTITSGGRTEAECTYSLHKNSTAKSGTLTLTYTKAGLSWLFDSAEKGDKLYTKKEILSIIESKEYQKKLIFSNLGLPKQFENEIDFDSPDWQNTAYNIITFTQLTHRDENSRNLTYDSKEDYSKKLQDFLKKSDDEMAHSELLIKNMLVMKVDSLKKEGTKHLKYLFENEMDSPAVYDYTFDGEKLILKENTKLTPAKMAFFACNSDNSGSTSPFMFMNGTAMQANTTERNIFIPKKSPSKDKGKLTFVNLGNPKDTFEASYKINRNEEISFDLEILSGNFKGTKIRISEKLDQIELTNKPWFQQD
ncbi:hypothetical protein [Treponema zioleckii]|uniref:hypothetical protein n=1 Tax=Treponema zioleckii TaxID=331680 RepID=UPI00168A66FD|nr:hypothetical protein [Treponema zioleckii]